MIQSPEAVAVVVVLVDAVVVDVVVVDVVVAELEGTLAALTSALAEPPTPALFM